MNRGFWMGIIIVLVVLLLTLVTSLAFYVPSGSATEVVAYLGLAHIVVAILIIGSMLYFDWDPFEPLR